MKMLKKGRMEALDWKYVVECNGKGFESSRQPCFDTFEIDLNDIVGVYYMEEGSMKIKYGFFCCNCHCFTVVPTEHIPKEFFHDYDFPIVVVEKDLEMIDRRILLSENDKKVSAKYSKYL